MTDNGKVENQLRQLRLDVDKALGLFPKRAATATIERHIHDLNSMLGAGAFGGPGHTIREDGSPKTQRTNLNFLEPDASLTNDDGGNNETEINMAIYGLLGGRAGGQTVRGGTAASENLTLDSTAHATKGQIRLNSILRMAATANNVIQDSAGNPMLTFATNATANTTILTINGDLRVNGNDIRNSGGTIRMTMAAASPGVTLAGNVRLNDYVGINVAPQPTGSFAARLAVDEASQTIADSVGLMRFIMGLGGQNPALSASIPGNIYGAYFGGTLHLDDGVSSFTLGKFIDLGLGMATFDQLLANGGQVTERISIEVEQGAFGDAGGTTSIGVDILKINNSTTAIGLRQRETPAAVPGLHNRFAAPLNVGADSTPEAQLDVMGSRSPAANANARIARVAGTLVEAGSGTHARLMGLEVTAPVITAGAAAVTDAATVYVSGAPSASGAANWALWVDAGAVRLDGTLVVGTAQTYTPTNVTTDRSYDANSTTLDELADVVGTIIADLQTIGLMV